MIQTIDLTEALVLKISNIFKGEVTYKAVAEVFGHEYVEPSSLI